MIKRAKKKNKHFRITKNQEDLKPTKQSASAAAQANSILSQKASSLFLQKQHCMDISV